MDESGQIRSINDIVYPVVKGWVESMTTTVSPDHSSLTGGWKLGVFSEHGWGMVVTVFPPAISVAGGGWRHFMGSVSVSWDEWEGSNRDMELLRGRLQSAVLGIILLVRSQLGVSMVPRGGLMEYQQSRGGVECS